MNPFQKFKIFERSDCAARKIDKFSCSYVLFGFVIDLRKMRFWDKNFIVTIKFYVLALRYLSCYLRSASTELANLNSKSEIHLVSVAQLDLMNKIK